MYFAGFDRVYDTLELEQNLDDLRSSLMTFSTWPEQDGSQFAGAVRIGRHLVQTTPDAAF